MFARVLTFQFKYDPKVEAQMRQISQDTFPVLGDQKGFIKLYELMDHANGRGIQMHLWESEADLEAYLDSPAFHDIQARAMAVLKDTDSALEKIEHFEVVNQS